MKRFFMIFLMGMMLFPAVIRGESLIDSNAFQRTLAHIGQGKTEPQTFNGGQIRLISCRTGVKGLDGLMIGVDITLKQGWRVRAPLWEISAGSWQADPLPVFRTDRQPTEPWTDAYTGRIVFPIWLSGPVGQAADVRVSYHLDLIPPPDQTEGAEITLVQKGELFLPLPATESYPTDTCAFIHQALKSAAVDLKQTDIIGQTALRPDGQINLRLIFPKKIEYVAIQPVNLSEFSVTQSLTDGHLFQAVIRSKAPLKSGDIIPIRIQSSAGCYIWNMAVEDRPLPPYHMPLPIWGTILSGFLFLLFSPLWVLLFRPDVRTQKELKHRARFIQKITGGALLILVGLWWGNIFPTAGVWPLWWICLWLGIAAYGLWQPVFLKWMIVPMIVFWPRPFYDWLNDISDGAKIGVVIWWGFCCFLTFNLWIIAPKWFLSLKKSAERSYHILIRFPFLLLMLWLGGGLIGSAVIEQDPILGQWPKGPAIVRVTNPVCITCLKDRISLFSKINPDVIPLYRADISSKIINEKYKLNQIDNKNFSIFIATDGHEIIVPVGIGYRVFYNLMKANF